MAAANLAKCACTPLHTLPLLHVTAYLRVFRLLWTIKRVERVLGRAWARLNDAAHAMATLRALEKEHGVDVSGAEKVGLGL